MRSKGIGDQELALLTYIAERDGATVGEAAEGFGAPRGLARSTVLTMMERLRRKKHLVRRRDRGVFRYVSLISPHDVMRDAVRSFVSRTLGGSVSPFVAYLTESGEVSDQELVELETLIRSLQERRTR